MGNVLSCMGLHFIRMTLALIWILAFLPYAKISDLNFMRNVARRKYYLRQYLIFIAIKGTHIWTTD